MFSLEELVVKPGDNLAALVEERALLFLDRFGDYPDTAFIPPETYRELIRELAYANRHSFKSPTQQGYQQIAYNTSLGTIHLKVVSEVKSFLMVGKETTFADFSFHYGIPRELWSDSSKMKLDEEFEKIVLEPT